MKRGDIVEIIEAAYAEPKSDSVWLDRLLRATASQIDDGLGVGAFFYDTRTYPLRVWNMRATENAVLPAEALAVVVRGATREYIERSWKRLSCATASEVPGWSDEPSRQKHFDAIGVKDIFSINAYDPSGVGCSIGALLPRVTKLTRARRATYERIATHVTTGFRLRRRLRDADAILSASGALLDARSIDARSRDARAALTEAVREIERARGKLRKRDPDRAVLSWRALVRARWSLVDHFEADGKRLIVAVANEPAPPMVEQLTLRQRSVLELASQGHGTCLIAYELGLADSTVRVLLMRAARVLGVRTRSAAIERFRRLRIPVNTNADETPGKSG